MESDKNKTAGDSIYELLSDDELHTALHAAGVRMDLLNGWEDLHPQESADCAWLCLLPESERAEFEREAIAIISNIRAELRRREFRKKIAG